jgi:CheY-like chemotaxis protein
MQAATALRVLSVEDDRVSALLMAQMLTAESGVDLRCAEDGAEAMAQLGDGWVPDLLVLDAHLPDTTGHALLAALRARPALGAAWAIMCSADGLAEDQLRASAAGFDGYWVKPVSRTLVREVLRALGAARP